MPVINTLTPTTIGGLIESSGTTPSILGILYAISFVFAARRFVLAYQPVRKFDPPRLFIASVAFGLFLRTLSFVSLAVLYFTNVRVDSSGSPTVPGDPIFFQRVLAVLFNVGDWAMISTYLLLVVVWVELLQSARRHFFSRSAMRRDWLIVAAVVNAVLYATQIGLVSDGANDEIALYT